MLSLRTTLTLVGLATGLTLASLSALAQRPTWRGRGWTGSIAPSGQLERIVFGSGAEADTIPFFANGQHAGPSFYVVTNGRSLTAAWEPDGLRAYRAEVDDVVCRLHYGEWRGQPALEVTLTNVGHTPFQPDRAGLRLGIDTSSAIWWPPADWPTGS